VYLAGYEWINHSLRPVEIDDFDFRVKIGGKYCKQPYSCSVFNISAMSFGALSANAVRALNKGAKLGNFAHGTGEGSISGYHREHGGDLIWEIGSGYFGCRTPDGNFDPQRFALQAREPQGQDDRDQALAGRQARPRRRVARREGDAGNRGSPRHSDRKGLPVAGAAFRFCNAAGINRIYFLVAPAFRRQAGGL
jgi:hypothetical protein